MSAGAINGTGGSIGGGQQANRFAELNSEDFVKVLLSELSNQDPFKPQDSAALLEQLSSLRNIESQMNLQKQMEGLLKQNQEQFASLILQNQVSSAGGLIGKMVVGRGADDKELKGLVTSVRVQNGQVNLELDTGQSLALERVTKIANQTE